MQQKGFCKMRLLGRAFPARRRVNDAIRAETAAEMRRNGAECADLFHHMARSAPPRVTHHVKSVIILIIKRRFKTSKGQGQGDNKAAV
jgi:hypothetical protein